MEKSPSEKPAGARPEAFVPHTGRDRTGADAPRAALPFPWDDQPQPEPRSLSEPLTETHRDPRILWQSQKMESLGLLAGGVAHDFNNCLLAIMGNADLLERILAEEESRDLLREIRHAATRAGELCDQLQAFAGRGNFRIEVVNLSETVRGMVRMLKVAVPPRIALRLDLAEGLPAVAADVSQIHQVVMNLVVNAAEAIGDRTGTISLRTGYRPADDFGFERCIIAPRSTAGAFVFLEVTDTGPGMDPLTLSRAFDPFYSTKPHGRGLGLASVLGIVRSHRGGIGVDTTPGQGAALSVLLPRHEAVATQVIRVPRQAAMRNGGRVLVVDDEEYLRVLAARMLTHLGYEVHLAESGDAALAICEDRADELDCVLLDLIMPGMDGAEVLTELQRRWPDLKVLLTSGYHEAEISRRFAGRGLAGFLQKPYMLDDLGRKLEAVLSSAAAAPPTAD